MMVLTAEREKKAQHGNNDMHAMDSPRRWRIPFSALEF